MRQVELEAVPALEAEIRQGVRPAVVEGALRAAGDNLRRIAEVESSWWYTDILQPIFARGGTAADVTAETAAFADSFGELEDRLVLGLFHGHQSHAWMKNIFEGFESVLVRSGLQAPTTVPPAICFLDLSGYTRLTEERGDAAAADLAGRLSRLVQRTSVNHGGKPVKWLGDGVMFHFREPGPGVLAALEMVDGAREAGLPPAHVGLHAGPVLFQEGDYFGRTVNVAARIADYARQGEVLVSQDVVDASAGLPVQYDSIGPVELKGLTEAIPLSVARRAS
jgi:adenylate cyclase